MLACHTCSWSKLDRVRDVTPPERETHALLVVTNQVVASPWRGVRCKDPDAHCTSLPRVDCTWLAVQLTCARWSGSRGRVAQVRHVPLLKAAVNDIWGQLEMRELVAKENSQDGLEGEGGRPQQRPSTDAGLALPT